MPNNSRIALLGPCYPYRGGNALFMGHIYEKLSAHFETTLINYKLLYPSLLFPGTTQFDKSQEVITPVPSQRMMNSINPISWYQTAALLNKEKFDLVAFDWYNPFFGPTLGSIARLLSPHYKGKKLFITENVISHEARLPDRLLTTYALSQADSFLTLSDKVVEQLQPWLGQKPVFRSELPVYDCYDMSHLGTHQLLIEETGLQPDEDEILLFFGYIRAYKGLDLLIEAMPAILQNRPKAKLLVVGESYEDIRQYENQVERLGLSGKVVIVHRFVPNEEVGRYFRASKLVVLPYRSATQSGILNIAYGFGKPVIVTPVGGLGEFVTPGETGLIADAATPEAITQAVKRFFEIAPQTDFSGAIRSRVEQNGFGRIHEVFAKILKSEF